MLSIFDKLKGITDKLKRVSLSGQSKVNTGIRPKFWGILPL